MLYILDNNSSIFSYVGDMKNLKQNVAKFALWNNL